MAERSPAVNREAMPRRRTDPNLAVQLGARLRATREAAGLTQQTVADRACSTAATISRFEAGDVTPTLGSVVALARALGVPAASLLDFTARGADPTDAEEATLLDQFRQLDPRYRAVVRGLVAALLSAG